MWGVPRTAPTPDQGTRRPEGAVHGDTLEEPPALRDGPSIFLAPPRIPVSYTHLTLPTIYSV